MVKKNYDDILSRFHVIPERNGQTDRRTDRFAISIWRVSMLIKIVLLCKGVAPEGQIYFENSKF